MEEQANPAFSPGEKEVKRKKRRTKKAAPAAEVIPESVQPVTEQTKEAPEPPVQPVAEQPTQPQPMPKTPEEIALEEAQRATDANRDAMAKLGIIIPEIKIAVPKPLNRPATPTSRPAAPAAVPEKKEEAKVEITTQKKEKIWSVPDSFLTAFHKKLEASKDKELLKFYLENLKADWLQKEDARPAVAKTAERPVQLQTNPQVEQIKINHQQPAPAQAPVPVQGTDELLAYADALYRDLTTSNMYCRNQNVARSEVERHLKGSSTVFTHKIESNYITVTDTRTGKQLNTYELNIV